MIKKLALIITGFLVSPFTYTHNLECQNNFPLFENILKEELHHLEQGDVDQVIEFNNRYNYSALFRNKHSNQYYLGGLWMGRDEYESRLTDVMNVVRSGDYSIEEFKLISIKADRITPIEEICVIPIEMKILDFGKIEVSTNDWIFIRSLEDNKWRTFTYLDNVKKQDFNEFFPDFPSDIQLK